MKPSPSILKLIIRRVLLIAVLYTLCLFLIINTQIGATVDAVQSNLLTSRLWEVGSYLSRDAKKHLILNIPTIRSDFYATPGIDYIIRGKDDKILFHSQHLVDYSPAKTPDRDSIHRFKFTGPDGSTFVGQSGWVFFENAPYLVQVTQSEAVASQFPVWLGHEFLYKVALLGVPFVFALAFCIVYSVRQALVPITDSSRQAQQINFATHGIRLRENDVPAELTPLIRAFNLALERLEAGIVAQKEFTANAAHELRTPLSVLLARINLLEDTLDRERLRGDVARMSRLVEQLLAAARLDYPGTLTMRRTDLAVVVREVCLDIWPLMIQKSLLLEVSGADGPVWADASHDSIYRALRNVLENALHYAPRDTAISVALTVSDAAAQIRVSDRGPGVPDADRGRIFERFWRRDSRQGSGAGIGLYIVRTTMRLHGGDVRIEDAPGGGSVFILSLPLPADIPISSVIPEAA